jgi:hypothetical protein
VNGVVDGSWTLSCARCRGVDRGCPRFDGGRGEEILAGLRMLVLRLCEPRLCSRHFLRRPSWQHAETDVEALVDAPLGAGV